ncbi:MAG: 30S ribosomal protein S8 [Patescibacteria group bacterium]|nr:30S ribosomal protein S8 [Patescibacteria group bacterium]
MYLNTLTIIKNGLERKFEKVKVPYSKNDLAVLELLSKRGYVDSVSRKGRGVKRIIEVKLKYNNDNPQISGIKFISRPSRRIYVGYKDLRKSRQGHGHFILSTPGGVKDGYEARKDKVGGELLFEIW